MISLDRNYWEVINLLFALSRLYLNILKAEEIVAISEQKILDVRKRLERTRQFVTNGDYYPSLQSESAEKVW